MKNSVSVIDIGIGNLGNIFRALEVLGFAPHITKSPREIEASERIFLPGVGSFDIAMSNIKRSGIEDSLKKAKCNNAKIVGVCLGMQLLFETGYEVKKCQGLGFLQGEVKKMRIPENIENSALRLPNIGWRKLEFNKNSKTQFQGGENPIWAYFVHSYAVIKTNPNHIKATINFGGYNVPAIVKKDNIVGFQFHPEISGLDGLALLKKALLGD